MKGITAICRAYDQLKNNLRIPTQVYWKPLGFLENYRFLESLNKIVEDNAPIVFYRRIDSSLIFPSCPAAILGRALLF